LDCDYSGVVEELGSKVTKHFKMGGKSLTFHLSKVLGQKFAFLRPSLWLYLWR
jgi:hypothetical protein